MDNFEGFQLTEDDNDIEVKVHNKALHYHTMSIVATIQLSLLQIDPKRFIHRHTLFFILFQ